MEKSKYRIIVDEIALLIASGKLKFGDKVLSENEIIAKYNVSNTTARKALDELENAGLISRIKGKGSIVLESSSVLTRSIGSFDAIETSFAENLHKDGFTSRIKILEQCVYNGKEHIEIGKKFYELKGKIYKIRILRYAGNVLLKDETRYIDNTLCAGVENLGDLDPFITTLRKNFGVKIDKVDRVFTATISGKANAYAFGNGKPLVVLEGVSITNNGRIVEIEKSFYRADKYKFSVESKS